MVIPEPASGHPVGRGPGARSSGDSPQAARPDGRRKALDAYAVTEELVSLNSTKATLRGSDVDGFLTEIATFRGYFPEYRKFPLVGILTSLAVEESVLSYAEKQGFLVLAVGDEIIEVKDQALSKPSLRVPPKPVPTLTPQAALRQTRGAYRHSSQPTVHPRRCSLTGPAPRPTCIPGS